MTPRHVVPTFEAPPMENQTLGRLSSASCEKAASVDLRLDSAMDEADGGTHEFFEAVGRDAVRRRAI